MMEKPNITGYYDYTYDIEKLDKDITSYLTEYEVYKMKKLEEEIEGINNKIKQTTIQLQKSRFNIEKNEKEEELNKLKEVGLCNVYKNETEKIMRLYKIIKSTEKKKVFGKKMIMSEQEKEMIPYRLAIIRDFLEVANNYVDINLIETTKYTNECPGCKYDMSSVFIDEYGIQECPRCSYSLSISHKDSKNIMSSSQQQVEMMIIKKDDDFTINYKKAKARYCGRQKEKIPSKLFDDMDKYFINNRILKPEDAELRKREPSPNLVSRDEIFKAMSATRNPCYEHINLIMHLYLGTPLPDISHIEEKMDICFEALYTSFKRLGIKSINIQFFLFKLLQMLSEPVRLSNFKVQQTPELLVKDLESWKKMCLETGEYGKSIGIVYIAN